METFKITNLLTFRVDIVLVIVTFIFNVDQINGYNTLGSPWRTNKLSTSSDSSGLCADILQVTRKLLENDLLRDVIYPKLSDDGMFSKSTKIIESRTKPKRNIVHFPSKHYYAGNNVEPFINQQEYELKLQQQLLNSNRSENSRFKRHGHNQKFYQQHFTKIGSLSSQTINLVPLTVPYEDTSSLEASKQPQAYLVDLSSLNEPTDDQVDLRSLRPRYYMNQGDHMERRQDDVKEQDEETDVKGETEGESNEPNVVKKTFGYKVTLYKSPNVQEPQILTEEFFGDGKKKKVIKVLKKDEDQASGKTRPEQLSQQPSSSSGQYIPKLGVSSTMDQSDEEELDAGRKLIGDVRKKFASEKGLEAKRTISKSGDESQHDKKGAKEKALREKTQIEFFEREKIFANDDNQKTEGEQQPEPNQFPVMNDRPALVRLTTVAPKKVNRQPITVVSPEDQNNDNDKYNGIDFQSLHDLLLKRLKGWREKGYKITTELEIVQRGAVHDKVRSVRERGKGQQTFQRYERGNAIRGKNPSSYIRGSLDDQKIRQIEPLSVNHNTDNDKMQLDVKENENKQINQKNLFSNLPKFLLEPADYEAELDGPEDKVQISPHSHRRPLHQLQPLQPLQTLPPHPHPHSHPNQYQFSQPQLHLSPHSIPIHHQQHHLQHTHSVLLPPPPEALKLQASPPSLGPKTTNLVSSNNTKGSNRPTKGKKYSFKGMTRKVTSEKRDEETIGKNQNVKDGKSVDQNSFKNSEKNKVSLSTTPVSTLAESKEFTNNKGDQSKKVSKSEDEQSKRRLAAQKKLKAKAKKKAKLKLQQNQLQNQVLQQQGNLANNVKQTDRNIFRSPVSIQEQVMFPASPLGSNSGRGNENPSIHSSLGIENSLNFFNGFHDGLYMPNENDFDDISFGNPTLISIPGLIDSPNGEQNPQITDHFKLLTNQKQIDGNNNQKQNFFGFQDYTEIGKKQRQNGISYEEPLTSHPVSPPHTEILIGTLNGPKKLTSSNSGPDSKANKIRNYPTSIQDITRGKKMSNSYTFDPSFGRESPDNLFLSQPGKNSEPILNQFKNGLTSNSKMTNEMNSWNSKAVNNHRNNNNAQNFQTTPITLPWYQHEVDNLSKSNPGQSSLWDQGKQKSKLITGNFNQPVDSNLRLAERDRGPIRFSTPKPISKQKMGFTFDEPLELITETPRELKPVDYPRLTWIEPEADKVKKRKQKKNKSKRLKNNKTSNNNVNSYQQQIQQFTDDMISIGFDSQRMRTPKAQDLLMRSSQIYPLIGGYSPFIMPSSVNEDFNVTVDSDDEIEDDESMNHQDDDNQTEFGFNYVGDDRGKTEEDKKEAVEEIMMKSSNFNTNVNDDNGEDYEDNDDANVNQSESAKQKQQQQQQQNIPNNPELLIKSKINDENKAKSNYNLISKNERDPDKPSSSQIWSQPCPTCPEL